jgi:hypothetical protein
VPEAVEVPIVNSGETSDRETNGRSRLVKTSIVSFLTLALFAGAFLGGRLSIDQDEIESRGFGLGYQAGLDTGYDNGYDAGENYGRTSGYAEGLKVGCQEAFRFDDGTYSHITPYNPSSAYNRYPGRYYKSKSGC